MTKMKRSHPITPIRFAPLARVSARFRAFLLTLLCLISAFPFARLFARDGEKVSPPNVVIFISDDMGWNDVGYHGSKIQTPNIGRLAAEGAQLDRFYVHPVCSPTRTALMTGQSQARFGITNPLGPRPEPWFNRRMLKTACPVVWEGRRARARRLDPILPPSISAPEADKKSKQEVLLQKSFPFHWTFSSLGVRIPTP